MADIQQLSDSQSQVAALLSQLREQAGPRGAVYAGRLLTPQDTPQSVMARTPASDVEEYGTMALPAAGALGAGMTKAQIKAGLRPIEEQLSEVAAEPARGIGKRVSKAELQQGIRAPASFATVARAGEIPQTPPHKMWPAWINQQTGEVRHATEVIPAGWHEPNTPKIFDSRYKMLMPDPNWTRGHVDPATFKAFTDEMLDVASKSTGARSWLFGSR
jgi:hypothetical protein